MKFGACVAPDASLLGDAGADIDLARNEAAPATDGARTSDVSDARRDATTAADAMVGTDSHADQALPKRDSQDDAPFPLGDGPPLIRDGLAPDTAQPSPDGAADAER